MKALRDTLLQVLTYTTCTRRGREPLHLAKLVLALGRVRRPATQLIEALGARSQVVFTGSSLTDRLKTVQEKYLTNGVSSNPPLSIEHLQITLKD